MPHQCLSCGHLFAEGSSALLAGCPQCKGTRFFYTQKPLAERDRVNLAQKAQKDLGQVVADLLANASPETAKALQAQVGKDGWATLRPRDIRRLVQTVQEEQARHRREENEIPEVDADRYDEVEEGYTVNRPPKEETFDHVAARARVENEIAAKQMDERPHTVNVQKPGQYEIDVQGLLERQPIVVHKDGAYLIHLASLFDQSKK